MTGSSLAAILIPLAGTTCLAAWLTLVFYVGGTSSGPTATRRPAAKALARPRRLTSPSQPPAQPIRARGSDSGPAQPRPRLATPGSRTTITAATPSASPPRSEEKIMHPMFVKLFLQTGTDDPLADEEDEQRTENRARRHRSRMATRLTNRDRDRRPRR